jgi:hypothetical protein
MEGRGGGRFPGGKGPQDRGAGQAAEKKEKLKRLKGLAHTNREGIADQRAVETFQNRVLSLSRESSSLFSDSYFTKKLEVQEGVVLSRETLWNERRKGGVEANRKRWVQEEGRAL